MNVLFETATWVNFALSVVAGMIGTYLMSKGWRPATRILELLRPAPNETEDQRIDRIAHRFRSIESYRLDVLSATATLGTVTIGTAAAILGCSRLLTFISQPVLARIYEIGAIGFFCFGAWIAAQLLVRSHSTEDRLRQHRKFTKSYSH